MDGLQELTDEINNDPAGMGYAGKTPAQIAALLSNASRQVDKSLMKSLDFIAAVDPGEFNGLTNAQRVTILNALKGVTMPSNGAARTFLINAFGAQSITVQALAAQLRRLIPRCVEVWGSQVQSVTEKDVTLALGLPWNGE